MLQVTEKAVEQVKKELEGMPSDVEVETPMIRLFMSVGWGGPSLQLALEESTNSEEDTITEVDGVKFVVHSSQSYYFDSVKLDYQKGMFGGEYKLSNV